MSFDQIKVWIGAMIALLAFVGFLVFHGVPCLHVSAAKPIPGWVTSAGVQHAAIALTGLVSSVVASVFGIKLTSTPKPVTTFLAEGNRTLGRTVLPNSSSLTIHQILGFIYIAGFFGIAAFAFFVDASKPNTLPESTASLGLFAFGAFLAIAQSFFSQPK